MQEDRKKKHELLAPAGSLDIAKAVLDAGADAVYLAGASFGARAYAANLSQEELFTVLDYAHLQDKSVHLTVNTLLKNRELEDSLFSFLRPLYEHGLDAVIVQDFGVLSFLHRNFPGLDLHASTQMSVMTGYGASFLKECGVSRIVTARELTLPEIRQLKEACGMEVECFIHGALCYCLSGQCLMSSMFGGRSGNRGRCAQPCRLAYRLTDAAGRDLKQTGSYPLSPKDLCALELLPDLCRAGVDSFKIEGRMKQLAYAAGVTRIYREYLGRFESDPEGWCLDPADMQALLDLGNRSGFSRGYYQKTWGRHMLADLDSSHSSKASKGQMKAGANPAKGNRGKRAMDAKGQMDQGKQAGLSEGKRDAAYKKQQVTMHAVLEPGKPALLKLSIRNKPAIRVELSGETVMPAKSRPLQETDVVSRLKKTGDSCFFADQVTAEIKGDCFLPVSAVNALRREGLDLLAARLLSDFYRECPVSRQILAGDRLSPTQPGPAHTGGACPANRGLLAAKHEPDLVVSITKKGMLSALWDSLSPDLILLDFASRDARAEADCCRQIRDRGRREEGLSQDPEDEGKLAEHKQMPGHLCKVGLCLPYLLRIQSTKALRPVLEENPFDYYLARSYDGIGFLLSCGIGKDQIILDAGVYAFSKEATASFAQMGLSHTTAPLELNKKELGHQQLSQAQVMAYGRIPLMVSAQCLYRNYFSCKREGKVKDCYLKDRYGNLFFVDARCQDCYNIIYNQKALNLTDRMGELRALHPKAIRLAFTTESNEKIRSVLADYRAGGTTFTQEDTRGHYNRGVE